MKIRNVKKNDLHQLAKLDKFANLTHWDFTEYQSSFNNQNHYIYVLENPANDIIGAMVVAVVLDEAEILQFWIKDTLKRHGYGKILLCDVLEILKFKGIARVFLEVRDGNVPAINLYKKLGFEVVGRRNNYYTVDSWQYDALTLLRNLS